MCWSPDVLAAKMGMLLAGLAIAPIATAQESACPAPEAHAFDFWIGSWDITNAQRNPAQPVDPVFYDTGEAVVRVHPVAKGCAVVEHWQGNLVWGEVRGFSVRSFDPESARWTLVLLWPLPEEPVASFSQLEGGFEHGRGVFADQTMAPDGTPILTRFTFSDIAPQRYRWDAANSIDGGLSWSANWVMRGTRRPADAEPIDPDSPALSVPDDPLCTEPEHRALDGLVGQWKGRTDGPLAPLPVTLEVRSILGGCALTEQWTIGEGEHFVVRAWDATTDQWVAWHLSSDDPKLRRLVSEPGAGPVFLYDDGEERVRESFLRKGKRWVWTVEDAHGEEPLAADLSAVLKPAD
jgi:hypothetical protein